jgi:IMP dehydrogenase/GMP reductase
MDDNTLKFAMAALGVIQIVMLGWFAMRQAVTQQKLGEVHDMVDGMAHEKANAQADAAHAQGELAGRDYVPPVVAGPSAAA